MIKKPKEFIDFRKLTKLELSTLSEKWQADALLLEMKLEKMLRRPGINEEKVSRIWDVANKLWRRLRILEKWRLTNKQKG